MVLLHTSALRRVAISKVFPGVTCINRSDDFVVGVGVYQLLLSCGLSSLQDEKDLWRDRIACKVPHMSLKWIAAPEDYKIGPVLYLTKSTGCKTDLLPRHESGSVQ